MSRLDFGGFEAGHRILDGLGVTGTAIAYPGDGTAHGGDRYGRISGVAGGTATYWSLAESFLSGRWYYLRFWLRFAAAPSAQTRLIGVMGGVNIRVGLDLRTDGKLNWGAGVTGATASALATNTWNCIEFGWRPNADLTWDTSLRVNGVAAMSKNVSVGSSSGNALQFGAPFNPGADVALDFDDWALNDDQGASHNTWPGTTGRTYVLRPVADNAIGANWKRNDLTANVGAAYDAVNNVPPTGNAVGTATNGDQIRNNVSDATETAGNSADVDLESLDDKGLGSYVPVAYKVVAGVADDSAAATVSVGVRGVSNPAIGAQTTATAAAAASGFASGWVYAPTSLVTDPVINPAVRPVARVYKATASATSALVAFLGAMVEVITPEPAAVALAPSAAVAVGTAHLTAETSIALAAASSAAAGTLAVDSSNAIEVALDAAAAAAGSSLALSAPATMLLDAAVAASDAAVWLTTPAAMLLDAAVAVSDAVVWLGIPAVPRWTPTLQSRWHSGQHVGTAAPKLRAAIRTGRFTRAYRPWPYPNDPPSMIGTSDPTRPWQATWTPDGAFTDLPAVLEVTRNKSKDLDGQAGSNGIESATVTIENVGYLEVPDPAGGPLSGHLRRRGMMSALRGYVADGRDPLVDEGGTVLDDPDANPWFGKLDTYCQIMIWEGYGDQQVPVFTGLIDDVDSTSNPDRIALTCRDFGGPLTDERIFGWNKDPACKDPITFIDRDQADNKVLVGENAEATTEQDGFEATNVADGDSFTSWVSDPVDTGAWTEWVDIRVPQGRYNDYVLWPAYAGMDIYVSVFARDYIDGDGETQSPTMDGATIPEGWAENGSGDVPGANGARPYVSFTADVSPTRLVRTLGHSFVMGDNSIIRIHFRNLAETTAGSGSHVAGVIELAGRARTLQPEAVKGDWILVDDVTDIAKIVFRWAGFREWAVESGGIGLAKKLVVGRDKFYMDLLRMVQDAVGYTFFMGMPTNENSIGVPTLRRTRAVIPQAQLDAMHAADPDREPQQPVATVTDGDLLQAIKVRHTNAPKPYIIRTRGRESKNGQTLGSSGEKRIMFTYRPPWSGAPMAGVLKHVVHTNQLFKTMTDLRFAAYYIALKAALSTYIATVEIPGHPSLDLDDHLGLLDLGTGLTTRMLILQRDSTFTTGENGKWTMTLQGPLIDVPDTQAMIDLIQSAVRA